MGEVYKARDTRLDRPVAIKVLSAEIAASVEGRGGAVTGEPCSIGPPTVTWSPFD